MAEMKKAEETAKREPSDKARAAKRASECASTRMAREEVACMASAAGVSQTGERADGCPIFDDPEYDKRYRAEYERIGRELAAGRSIAFQSELREMRARLAASPAANAPPKPRLSEEAKDTLANCASQVAGRELSPAAKEKLANDFEEKLKDPVRAIKEAAEAKTRKGVGLLAACSASEEAARQVVAESNKEIAARQSGLSPKALRKEIATRITEQERDAVRDWKEVFAAWEQAHKMQHTLTMYYSDDDAEYAARFGSWFAREVEGYLVTSAKNAMRDAHALGRTTDRKWPQVDQRAVVVLERVIVQREKAHTLLQEEHAYEQKIRKLKKAEEKVKQPAAPSLSLGSSMLSRRAAVVESSDDDEEDIFARPVEAVEAVWSDDDDETRRFATSPRARDFTLGTPAGTRIAFATDDGSEGEAERVHRGGHAIGDVGNGSTSETGGEEETTAKRRRGWR